MMRAHEKSPASGVSFHGGGVGASGPGDVRALGTELSDGNSRERPSGGNRAGHAALAPGAGLRIRSGRPRRPPGPMAARRVQQPFRIPGAGHGARMANVSSGALPLPLAP